MSTIEKYTLMELGILVCLRKDGELSLHPLAHNYPSIAIEAGIILELILRKNVTQASKDSFVVTDATPTGDVVLDEALILMKDNTDATMKDWIRHINGTAWTTGIKHLSGKIFQQLCDKKILNKENALIGHKYPFANEPEIDAITQELKDAIMALTIDDLSPKMMGLLGLFHALDKPFHYLMTNAIDIKRIYPDKTELANARKNLEKLLDSKNDTNAELVVDGQSIINKANEIARKQMVKQLVIHVFCPILGVLMTVRSVAGGVKNYVEQKNADKEKEKEKEKESEDKNGKEDKEQKSEDKNGKEDKEQKSEDKI